jgi:hypothetical protein
MAEDVQAVAEPAYPLEAGRRLIYANFHRRTQKMPVRRARPRGVRGGRDAGSSATEVFDEPAVNRQPQCRPAHTRLSQAAYRPHLAAEAFRWIKLAKAAGIRLNCNRRFQA